MLRVEVQAKDTHVFTMDIDSVLEVPTKGSPIVCGKCRKETTVLNVGVPYRPDANGKNPTVDSGQENLFKET